MSHLGGGRTEGRRTGAEILCPDCDLQQGKGGGEQLGGHWSVDSIESQPAHIARKGAGHKTERLIWWEVGRNCRGSLTVPGAVSQYGWRVTVQTSDYWRELLRTAISHTCCMLN